MRPPACLIVLILFSLVAMELPGAQTQPSEQKATTPREAKDGDQEIGKSYETLRLEQKRLVDDFVSRYNQTTGSKLVPEQAYDNARLSIRTTFGAVTDALVKTKLTDSEGKSLGRAIDLERHNQTRGYRWRTPRHQQPGAQRQGNVQQHAGD